MDYMLIADRIFFSINLRQLNCANALILTSINEQCNDDRRMLIFIFNRSLAPVCIEHEKMRA